MNIEINIFTVLKTLQRLKQEWQKSPPWDQANRQQKIGLVWRNRKKISQIVNDNLFLLIILWFRTTTDVLISASTRQAEISTAVLIFTFFKGIVQIKKDLGILFAGPFLTILTWIKRKITRKVKKDC